MPHHRVNGVNENMENYNDKKSIGNDELNSVLTELKQSLVELLHDKFLNLVLFGSRARGDYDADSDIDVAIVVKGLDRQLKNLILDKVADLELKYLIVLSTLVLSEEAFEELKRRERRIAIDIEAEGIRL